MTDIPANLIPANLIPAINRVVRLSQRLLVETGHHPNAEELAARLAIPLEQVEKLMTIARLPIGGV